MMSVTVTLAFSVKPERADEFKSLLKELLPDTRAYDGCQNVDVYQDQDNPGLIPSRRQRSLTVTSRLNPSRTMRILSSGAYFLRVLVRTSRMKVLVS